MVYKCIK